MIIMDKAAFNEKKWLLCGKPDLERRKGLVKCSVVFYQSTIVVKCVDRNRGSEKTSKNKTEAFVM